MILTVEDGGGLQCILGLKGNHCIVGNLCSAVLVAAAAEDGQKDFSLSYIFDNKTHNIQCPNL